MKLKVKDVPADILAAIKADETILDELTHDLKSGEAASINNAGFMYQLNYARGVGVSWSDIRKAMGLPEPG
jgi:hypothetical protein